MNDFSFIIQQPYYRNKKLPVGLLHFTAGFLLLSAFLESGAAGYPRGVAIGFLILGLLEIVYTFLAARLQRSLPAAGETIRIITALAFLLYAILLFKDQQTLFGICMTLIALAFMMIFMVERRWNRPFVLKVNEQGVWFPRFFKYQLFPWRELNLVMLRGDVITLDFTDNRVVQMDLDQTFDREQSEAFNAFCVSRAGKKH